MCLGLVTLLHYIEASSSLNLEQAAALRDRNLFVNAAILLLDEQIHLFSQTQDNYIKIFSDIQTSNDLVLNLGNFRVKFEKL
jgi:hypothetical protein